MTQTTSAWHVHAKNLAEIINREAVKYDKASGSRCLNEEIATAHIEWFLAELAQRISDATRILQTREIMACQTPKQ